MTVDGPAFAGVTVRVPLTEEPSQAWLDLLALQAIPGKGHRVAGAAVEFYLDRGTTNVQEVIKVIAAAITKTSTELAPMLADLEAKAEADRNGATAYRGMVDRRLDTWWSEQRPAELPQATDDSVAQEAGPRS